MKTLTNWNIIIVDNCSNVGCDKISYNCKSHKVHCVTLYLQSRENYKHMYNLLHLLSRVLDISTGIRN